jgi:uncharacterized protein YfdQ (DUF2303 family)
MAEPKTEFRDAYNAGMCAAQPKSIGENAPPWVVVPNECHLEDLSHLMEAPLRKKAVVAFEDVSSFVRYVNANKGPTTVIFASGKSKLEAILDYHTAGPTGPGAWCQHRAILDLKVSPEWQLWASRAASWMGQKDFAELIEDRQIDFYNPPGAQMLEIALTISGKTQVSFESGFRLDNGDTNLAFKETTGAKAGQRGELPIPGELTLLIPIYAGGEVPQVTARLRYRIDSGAVFFKVILNRPDRVLDAAFKTTVDAVAKQTSITPYNGRLQ